jgi:hypothetical protein
MWHSLRGKAMTDISKEAIERLLDGVTPGSWEWTEIDPDDPDWSACEIEAADDYVSTMVLGTDNARFIAAARDVVPALAAERDEWKARAEKAEAERLTFRAVLVGAQYGDIDGIAQNTVEQSTHLGEVVAGITKIIVAERDALAARVAELEAMLQARSGTPTIHLAKVTKPAPP